MAATRLRTVWLVVSVRCSSGAPVSGVVGASRPPCCRLIQAAGGAAGGAGQEHTACFLGANNRAALGGLHAAASQSPLVATRRRPLQAPTLDGSAVVAVAVACCHWIPHWLQTDRKDQLTQQALAQARGSRCGGGGSGSHGNNT